MRVRTVAGALVLMALGAMTSSAVAPLVARTRASIRPGNAVLHAFGHRSETQLTDATSAKFDGALADLTRHVAGRAGLTLAQLHDMSPAARFKSAASGEPLVLIDAVTRGDPATLRDALTRLGMEHASLYANDVGGWMPLSQLQGAAARSEVQALRAAMSRRRSGAVTSQGDFAIRADVVRSADSLTGAGVTVGILSDSYDCYATYAANGVDASGPAGYASNGFLATAATDVGTGDLPASVNVLADADCLDYGSPEQLPFTDEGRAMLQVVHDVAPGAALAFYTAENSEADFANGIGALANAGATVIADDVGYFDEPFFQDGLVAQAIDAVEAKGVAYFVAAGNDGSLSYENVAPTFATQVSTTTPSGEYLLNFDASGATNVTALPVTIASLQPGEFVAIVLEWDQPYVTGATSASPGATSHLDLCVTGATGSDQIVDLDFNAETCTGANATGADPYQILIIGNPASATSNTAAETVNLVVGLTDGTAAPGRIKLAIEDDGAGSTIDAFAAYASNPTLQGHSGAAGSAAVGAAFYFETPRCGTTPATLESYSSVGGSPILFDTSGTRLATPTIRQKPDFVGPDGGNDTFLGYTLSSAGVSGGMLDTSISECQNVAAYPNFFGTSAATPHVAGIAALMLQANSAATPSQLYAALRSSALPMGSVPNFESGYGFVQADAALALLSPGTPTLSASPATVSTGGSVKLTWSSVNTSSCAAGGAWSGALAASGSQSVTASTPGTLTYTLTCSNAAGTSAAASATVTVSAASGGGGGAVDTTTLAWLALLAVARRPLIARLARAVSNCRMPTPTAVRNRTPRRRAPCRTCAR